VLTRFQKTFTLFAVLLAGGCAMGPHYKSPQPAAVKYHAANANLETEAPFDSRWWKQFEDPVLDSLVDRTLTSNNSIRIARARLAESRAIFDERKLDRYPTILLAPGSTPSGKPTCSDGLATGSRQLAPKIRRSKRTFTMRK